MPTLLEQTEHALATLTTNGIYDRKSVYEAAQRKDDGQVVRVLIPLTRNARLRSPPTVTLTSLSGTNLNSRRLARRA